MDAKQQHQEVLRRLRARYTISKESFVLWSNPLELLVGTVLSAQCTDKRVNMVTKELFQKYKTAQDYANADIKTLEKEIFSIGFYRSKAKYLKGIGQLLTENHDGEVPKEFNALLTLPGVSRKTAHLIMAKAWGVYTGVAVDTHVKRLAPRLGWTKDTNNVAKIERDLNAIAEPKDYLATNELLILLGRDLCGRTPKCGECPLRDICPTGIEKPAQC